MGRDKPKKYSKMGYFEKQRYYEEQGDKYNINRDDFENSQGGGGRYEDFDYDGFHNAVENAQRNDFDYRTSAQHMDGVKGDASSADFINYQRAATKLHRKAGNEGEYSSNKDITNVTNNLVNDANNFLMNKIDGMTAKEQQSQAESGVAAPASTQLQDARDTVDELGNKDYDIFAANINNGDNQNQRDQASEAFLGKYKLDLKNKKGISPVLPS